MANPPGKICVFLMYQHYDHEDGCIANRPYSLEPRLRADSNLYIDGTGLCPSVHLAGSPCNEEYHQHSIAHPAARRQGNDIYAVLVRFG